MPLKISFNNQTHKVSKLPENFQDLKNLIQLIFSTQLPTDWTLQYLDTEGDLIMLSDEHDYTNLKEDLAGSNSSIKISVASIDNLNKKENEDYQVLEKEESSESSQTELIKEEEIEQQQQEEEEEQQQQQPVEVIPPSSQEVEVPKTEEIQTEKVEQTEQTEQEHSHGKFRNHQVKRILKKLSKASLPEQQREKLEGVLAALQRTFTEEQKKDLQKKREKLAKKQAEKLQERKAELSEIVTDMIYANLPTIASFTKEFIEDKQNPFAKQPQPTFQEEPKQVVHHGVFCDGCGVGPIVGIRYKCTVCHDFDFCEDCEDSVEHAHPFIKFKKVQERHRRRGGVPLLFGFPPQPFCGGWERRGNREGCPMRGERQCPFKQFEQKPEAPKKEETKKEQEQKEFSGFGGLGSLLGDLLSGNPFGTEQKPEDIFNLFSGVQKEAEEVGSQLYQSVPEELRKQMNEMLGGLPEMIFQKKAESKPEEKNEEVKIEEIPIPKVQTQTQSEGNEPLIQEIVIEKEKVEEPVKQKYAQNVVEKARKLREIFVEASVEDLCEFVSKVPQLSLEELVDNFLVNL